VAYLAPRTVLAFFFDFMLALPTFLAGEVIPPFAVLFLLAAVGLFFFDFILQLDRWND